MVQLYIVQFLRKSLEISEMASDYSFGDMCFFVTVFVCCLFASKAAGKWLVWWVLWKAQAHVVLPIGRQ